MEADQTPFDFMEEIHYFNNVTVNYKIKQVVK